MPFTLNLSGTTQVDDSIVLAYDQQFIVAAAQEQVMDQFVTWQLRGVRYLGIKSAYSGWINMIKRIPAI